MLQYHKNSMKELNRIISRCENPSARIEQSICKSLARVVDPNRKYLSAKIRATEYYGRRVLRITRRGNGDVGPLFHDKRLNVNRQNFKELITLKPDLAANLKNAYYCFAPICNNCHNL